MKDALHFPLPFVELCMEVVLSRKTAMFQKESCSLSYGRQLIGGQVNRSLPFLYLCDLHDNLYSNSGPTLPSFLGPAPFFWMAMQIKIS